MANHIGHFEIFASDVERARTFYERVFAWRFEVGGPPSQGALNGFRCTVSVSTITETAAAITAAGGALRSAVIEIPDRGSKAPPLRWSVFQLL
jgi:predicted enzyme related to lactoylglutathione lyase